MLEHRKRRGLVAGIFLLAVALVGMWLFPHLQNPAPTKAMNKTFVTAVGCIDGREWGPVSAYMRERYGTNWVDTITYAGVVKILAENQDRREVERLIRLVRLSVEKHRSHVIAIVAHDQCAGNPEKEKREQLQQLQAARLTMRSYGFDAKIILLWVEDPWEEAQLIE